MDINYWEQKFFTNLTSDYKLASRLMIIENRRIFNFAFSKNVVGFHDEIRMAFKTGGLM